MKRIKPSRPLPEAPVKPADDIVPSTLEEAIQAVLARVAAPDVQTFIKNPESKPAMVHESMGQGMRNAWSLWDKETVFVRHCIDTYGLSHGDDISGLIFHCVWKDVRGEDRDIDGFVQSCKDHWRKMGIDPKTGEKLLVTLD